MADVVKLVNTLDCGSSISWVRVPSFAPLVNHDLCYSEIFLCKNSRVTAASLCLRQTQFDLEQVTVDEQIKLSILNLSQALGYVEP